MPWRLHLETLDVKLELQMAPTQSLLLALTTTFSLQALTLPWVLHTT